jgi:hypothetical protein
MIPYSINDGRVVFKVHVVPGSPRSEVVGTYNDSLRVRVAARPVEGAANEELILTLAKTFRVSKSSVRIVGGARGRSKQVSIEGEPEEVVAVLAAKSQSEHGRQ